MAEQRAEKSSWCGTNSSLLSSPCRASTETALPMLSMVAGTRPVRLAGKSWSVGSCGGVTSGLLLTFPLSPQPDCEHHPEEPGCAVPAPGQAGGGRDLGGVRGALPATGNHRELPCWRGTAGLGVAPWGTAFAWAVLRDPPGPL